MVAELEEPEPVSAADADEVHEDSFDDRMATIALLSNGLVQSALEIEIPGYQEDGVPRPCSQLSQHSGGSMFTTLSGNNPDSRAISPELRGASRRGSPSPELGCEDDSPETCAGPSGTWAGHVPRRPKRVGTAGSLRSLDSDDCMTLIRSSQSVSSIASIVAVDAVLETLRPESAQSMAYSASDVSMASTQHIGLDAAGLVGEHVATAGLGAAPRCASAGRIPRAPPSITSPVMEDAAALAAEELASEDVVKSSIVEESPQEDLPAALSAGELASEWCESSISGSAARPTAEGVHGVPAGELASDWCESSKARAQADADFPTASETAAAGGELVSTEEVEHSKTPEAVLPRRAEDGFIIATSLPTDHCEGNLPVAEEACEGYHRRQGQSQLPCEGDDFASQASAVVDSSASSGMLTFSPMQTSSQKDGAGPAEDGVGLVTHKILDELDFIREDEEASMIADESTGYFNATGSSLDLTCAVGFRSPTAARDPNGRLGKSEEAAAASLRVAADGHATLALNVGDMPASSIAQPPARDRLSTAATVYAVYDPMAQPPAGIEDSMSAAQLPEGALSALSNAHAIHVESALALAAEHNSAKQPGSSLGPGLMLTEDGVYVLAPPLPDAALVSSDERNPVKADQNFNVEPASGEDVSQALQHAEHVAEIVPAQEAACFAIQPPAEPRLSASIAPRPPPGSPAPLPTNEDDVVHAVAMQSSSPFEVFASDQSLLPSAVNPNAAYRPLSAPHRPLSATHVAGRHWSERWESPDIALSLEAVQGPVATKPEPTLAQQQLPLSPVVPAQPPPTIRAPRGRPLSAPVPGAKDLAEAAAALATEIRGQASSASQQTMEAVCPVFALRGPDGVAASLPLSDASPWRQDCVAPIDENEEMDLSSRIASDAAAFVGSRIASGRASPADCGFLRPLSANVPTKKETADELARLVACHDQLFSGGLARPPSAEPQIRYEISRPASGDFEAQIERCLVQEQKPCPVDSQHERAAAMPYEPSSPHDGDLQNVQARLEEDDQSASAFVDVHKQQEPVDEEAMPWTIDESAKREPWLDDTEVEEAFSDPLVREELPDGRGRSPSFGMFGSDAYMVPYDEFLEGDELVFGALPEHESAAAGHAERDRPRSTTPTQDRPLTPQQERPVTPQLSRNMDTWDAAAMNEMDGRLEPEPMTPLPPSSYSQDPRGQLIDAPFFPHSESAGLGRAESPGLGLGSADAGEDVEHERDADMQVRDILTGYRKTCPDFDDTAVSVASLGEALNPLDLEADEEAFKMIHSPAQSPSPSRPSSVALAMPQERIPRVSSPNRSSTPEPSASAIPRIHSGGTTRGHNSKMSAQAADEVAQDLFDRLDTDRDGAISQGELQRALQAGVISADMPTRGKSKERALEVQSREASKNSCRDNATARLESDAIAATIATAVMAADAKLADDKSIRPASGRDAGAAVRVLEDAPPATTPPRKGFPSASASSWVCGMPTKGHYSGLQPQNSMDLRGAASLDIERLLGETSMLGAARAASMTAPREHGGQGSSKDSLDHLADMFASGSVYNGRGRNDLSEDLSRQVAAAASGWLGFASESRQTRPTPESRAQPVTEPTAREWLEKKVNPSISPLKISGAQVGSFR